MRISCAPIILLRHGLIQRFTLSELLGLMWITLDYVMIFVRG
jgi:hypothetical protein